jgi:hypothetical protein
MKTNHDAESSFSFDGTRSRGKVLLLIGLLTLAVFVAPAASRAGSISVGISVGIAPPPIPVYAQPVCPGPGYMWTPGYWAYDPVNGYFWVPGTWVLAPTVGFFWTPGYWGWGGSAFIWHEGYWGPHVGFYGGINYGFGYNGSGYAGGEWRGRDFYYNRAVNNFGGGRFDHVYERPVMNNFAVNRVSYNGGRGGLSARPTSSELAAEHDRHIEGTAMQRQHEMAAHNERGQFASVNQGRPGIAATGRPREFRGAGVVQATRAGGPVNASEYHGGNTGHPTSYSGSHTPNPGGGGSHEVMTTHQTTPASHSYGTPQGGTASGQTHTPTGSQNEGSHGSSFHSTQPQEHTSHPSGGGTPARASGAPHEGGESHEPHH